MQGGLLCRKIVIVEVIWQHILQAMRNYWQSKIIQILMRWSLQKLFIGGFTDEEGEVFTNKYLTAGVRQWKNPNESDEREILWKIEYGISKERNHDKWHPCTHLIKKDGKYYVYYRSGKNVYKWSVQYLEDQQIIELQHVWNIADYVMWIPLAAMDVFFACFCVFNKLWQYIPVLCMVIAVLEFLPYYVFVARLGENVVTKYIISCLEDKDL